MTTWYIAPAPLGNNTNDGLSPTTPFATLGKAKNSTSNGDTIQVLAGTYTQEAIRTDFNNGGGSDNNNVKIYGPNANINPVTNWGDRLPEAIIDGGAGGAAIFSSLITIGRTNPSLVISGIEIKGLKFLNVTHVPIDVKRAPGLIVENNIIDGVLNTDIGASELIGVNIRDNSNNFQVKNNFIRRNVFGITAGSNVQNGIISGNELQRSDFSQQYGGGINIREQNGTTTNIEITNNIFHNIHKIGQGIYTWETGSGTLENIRIHHNTFYDIDIAALIGWGGDGIEFDHNTVECQYIGVNVINGANNTYIHDNTFNGCQGGVSAQTYSGYFVSYPTFGLRVEDNTFNMDVTKFEYNASGIECIRVKGNIIIKNNTINISGGLVGSNPYNVLVPLGTYVGGAAYGIRTIGIVENLDVSENCVNMNGVITASSMIDNGVTKNVDVNYPYSSGICLYSKNNTYGNIGVSAVIRINNNIFLNAKDGYGVSIWDNINQTYGGLALILDARANQLSGNKSGVNNDADTTPGPGEYVDAKYCWWGDKTGPSGGAPDIISGNTADGNGVLVSYNVAWGEWRKNPTGVPDPNWKIIPDNAQGLTRDIVGGARRNGNLVSESAQSAVGFDPDKGPLILWHRVGGVTPNRAHLGIGSDNCRSGQIGYKYNNRKK